MVGAGLGIALLLYAFDLIGRITDDMKDFLPLGPFSYCNASEIFAKIEIQKSAFIWAAMIMTVAAVLAFKKYTNKDLAA